MRAERDECSTPKYYRLIFLSSILLFFLKHSIPNIYFEIRKIVVLLPRGRRSRTPTTHECLLFSSVRRCCRVTSSGGGRSPTIVILISIVAGRWRECVVHRIKITNAAPSNSDRLPRTLVSRAYLSSLVVCCSVSLFTCENQRSSSRMR